jgi:hypothetical protein
VNKNRPSLAPRVLRRVAFATLAAAAVVAPMVIGVAATSSSPLPKLAANFKCLPTSSIPQLKAGKRARLTTSYGGFTATFRSVKQPTAKDGYPLVGTPFTGTLTMTHGGKSWTLPRADNTQESQFDVLCVIAFNRERTPGVMVEGYTGGAHCCEAPVIYLFNRGTDRFDKVVDMSPIDFEDAHAFDANEGFLPLVVGSHVLLKTYDGLFDYAFACYACSEEPIVLDSVGPGGLTDVTGQHSSIVTADAAAIWKNAQRALVAERPALQSSVGPFGFLAPWVADECVLGRGATAWSTIESLNREGKLSNARYHLFATDHGSFVADLHAFLLRDDYCIGEI